MNADGTNKMNLTNGSGWHESPVWSPDGSRIAFMISEGNIGPGAGSYICVMNADGTNKVKLTKE